MWGRCFPRRRNRGRKRYSFSLFLWKTQAIKGACAVQYACLMNLEQFNSPNNSIANKKGKKECFAYLSSQAPQLQSERCKRIRTRIEYKLINIFN